jgi:hypothetical protein
MAGRLRLADLLGGSSPRLLAAGESQEAGAIASYLALLGALGGLVALAGAGAGEAPG